MPRYAIYFTPEPTSALALAGNSWLGRSPVDVEDGGSARAACPFPVDADWLWTMTASPRRYGFHATLKAPMHLAAGTLPEDFIARVKAWAAERPVTKVRLQCATLGQFVALKPADQTSTDTLRDLAGACVREFEDYRAPLAGLVAIDRVAVFEEPEPGLDFFVRARAPFAGAHDCSPTVTDASEHRQ